MKHKIRMLLLVLAPAVALGLVGCDGKTSSPTGPISTTNPPPITSTSDGGGTTSSTTTPSILDEIVGTADERYATFTAADTGAAVTIYAQLMIDEQFEQGGNHNLYFMDGTHAYRAINIPDASAAGLAIGNIYKVEGKKASGGFNGKSDTTIKMTVVPQGETKISVTPIDLNTATLKDEDANAICKMVDGIVTVVSEATSSAKTALSIAVNGTTYILTTRGLTADAVDAKLATAQIGQKISFTKGYIYKVATKQINILDADALTLGEVVPDYNGTIARDAGKLGGADLTATVDENVITFGGADQVIGLSDDGVSQVGIQLTMPRSAVKDEIKITKGTETHGWTELGGGDSIITLAVTPADDLSDVVYSVVWKTGIDAEVFTVKFAAGTKLTKKISGTVGKDEAFPNVTFTKEDDGSMLIGGAGQTLTLTGDAYIYKVAFDIPAALNADTSKVSYKIGETTVANADITIEGGKLIVPLTIEAKGQEFVLEITWTEDSATAHYLPQTETIKVSGDIVLVGTYSGTVAIDDTIGAVDDTHKLTAAVDGDSIAIGGAGQQIAYGAVVADGVEGNWIGIKITKPADLPDGMTPKYVIGEEAAKEWPDLASPLLVNFKVEAVTDTFTVKIYWDGDVTHTAQTITVTIAEGTRLQTTLQANIIDSTIDEIAVKTAADYTKLVRVTGIVTAITSDSNGQGYIMDPTTGTKLMFYRLSANTAMFDSWKGTETKNPSNQGDFADLGLKVSDKVTIVGVQAYYKPDMEIIGYCEALVDQSTVEYDIKLPTPANGTVTAAKNKAVQGEAIEITVTANTGYVIEYVKYNGEDVTLTDGKFTINVLPYNEVTVSILEDITYTVTVNGATNGTVKTEAGATDITGKLYQDVVVVLTPDNGYEVGTVKFNGDKLKVVDNKVTITIGKTNVLDVQFVVPSTSTDVTYLISEDTADLNTGSTVALATSADSLLAILQNSKTGNENDIITSLSGLANVYTRTATEGPIKMGTSGNPGSLTFNLNTQVTKVTLRAVAWKGKTGKIIVNGVELVLPTATTAVDAYDDYVFEFDATDTITISTVKANDARIILNAITFTLA